MSSIFKSKVVVLSAIYVLYGALIFPVLKNAFAGMQTVVRDFHNLESPKLIVGDFSSYLESTLSVFEFDLNKKFNDKHIPLFTQKRRVHTKDFPPYAPYLLALYPYPASKPGYALLCAGLTGCIPKVFFEKQMERLALANLIFLLLSIALVFLIGNECLGSPIAAAFPALIFSMDVSNSYNAIFYKSHTACGIALILLTFYLFLKWRPIKEGRFAFLSFLLSLSILASTHTVMIALVLLPLIFLVSIWRKPAHVWGSYVIAGVMAFAALPLYFVGVETWFSFDDLGLATMKGLFASYKGEANIHILTQPPNTNFVWDFRIFNLFAFPILVLGIALTLNAGIWRETKYFCKNLVRSLRQKKLADLFEAKMIIFVLALLVFHWRAVNYSVPISRAMAPFTVFYGMLFSIVVAWAATEIGRWGTAVCLGILLLCTVNFSWQLEILPFPKQAVSEYVVVLDDVAAISKNALNYMHDRRAKRASYQYTDRSVENFVRTYESKFSSEKVFLKFDPQDLVSAFAPTFRLVPGLVKDDLVVTENTFLQDFRFINEVMALWKKGVLKEGDLIRKKKWLWPFSLWDSEYNYIYGYQGHIKKYLNNLPLGELDMHSVYYIRFEALRRFVSR